eukprot:TRINITY_DN14083_c0_g2_i2.p1 TRINITY_DN14083_c0_g2~~TRINITY_DN14083_c0_g2_i2.p1  ORF type:complete len:412 (-),score=51.05 TRINITY_DN14083_c0_g2_i2:79-1314(-)
MSRRPDATPAPSDREVWVDPLPDGELEEWLKAFGDSEDVFRVEDPATGDPAERGYVVFSTFDGARACVEAGAGAWSESERALAWFKERLGQAVCCYPESTVMKLLGNDGESILQVRDACGLRELTVRGDGLPGAGARDGSKRLHFVAEGDPAAIAALRPKLEEALSDIHGSLSEKLKSLGEEWKSTLKRKFDEMKRSNEDGRRCGHDELENPAAQDEAGARSGVRRHRVRRRRTERHDRGPEHVRACGDEFGDFPPPPPPPPAWAAFSPMEAPPGRFEPHPPHTPTPPPHPPPGHQYMSPPEPEFWGPPAGGSGLSTGVRPSAAPWVEPSSRRLASRSLSPVRRPLPRRGDLEVGRRSRSRRGGGDGRRTRSPQPRGMAERYRRRHRDHSMDSRGVMSPERRRRRRRHGRD